MVNEIVNNKVNLCDSCSQVYPDCTSKPENVYFGDGIRHDNICACSEYQPSTRPQLEECPIYGGMCGYPSNLCYECPRHGGAKEKELWWKIPSAQPMRKKGRWIYGEHDIAMCDGYMCDKCGFFVPWDYKFKFIDFINDYHFCPNCGSDMRGEQG